METEITTKENVDPTVFQEGKLVNSLMAKFKPDYNGPAINRSGVTPETAVIRLKGNVPETPVVHMKTQEEILENEALCEQYYNEAIELIRAFRLEYPSFPEEKLPTFTYRSVKKAKAVLPSTVKKNRDNLEVRLKALVKDAAVMAKTEVKEAEIKAEKISTKKIDKQKEEDDMADLDEINRANTQVGGKSIAVMDEFDPEDFDPDMEDFDEDEEDDGEVDDALAEVIYDIEHDGVEILVNQVESGGTPIPHVMAKMDRMKPVFISGWKDLFSLYPDDPIVKLIKSPGGKLGIIHARLALTLMADIYIAKKKRLAVK